MTTASSDTAEDTGRADLIGYVAAALGDGNLYPQWAQILAPTIVDRLNLITTRSYRVTNDVRRETFHDLDEALVWAQILDNMHRDVPHRVETMMHVSFETPWSPISEQ